MVKTESESSAKAEPEKEEVKHEDDIKVGNDVEQSLPTTHAKFKGIVPSLDLASATVESSDAPVRLDTLCEKDFDS